MQLRKYQADAHDAIITSWEQYDKTLLVLPTGGGKTIVIASICDARKDLGKILILAHREELINQAQEKILLARGLKSSIEKSNLFALLDDNIVVASIQTLLSRKERWPFDHFKTIIVDEAHHLLSDSYQIVLSYFKGAKVLGVTASPDRGDQRNLGSYFEDVAYEVGLPELIKQGFLCPIVARTVPLQIDITSVKKTAGDYNAGDLGSAIEPVLTKVAESIRDFAADRKTLIFTPLIETSQNFVQSCNSIGLHALHVDGQSKDRKEILQKFASMKTGILSNSMLLTEGYDQPDIDCVIVLRPTQSRALYSQMVGRGTRIAEGKKNLLILDFLWQTQKHSLVKAAHLISKSDQEADLMTKRIEAGEELGLNDAQDEAVKEIENTREKSLLAAIKSRSTRKSNLIDPIEFGLSMHDNLVTGFESTMRWHDLPISPGQEKTLVGMGIDVDQVQNRGHASVLLDLIFTRRKMKLATPKQVRILKKFNHPSPNTATFEDANQFITKAFSK